MAAETEIREVPIFLRTFTAAETASGRGILRAELGDVPLVRAGLEAHLAWIRIDATVKAAAVAATMPAAMPGRQWYTAIRAIRLESELHAFLRSVDGLDVVDDHALRFGYDFETVPADLADADAAAATQAISMVYRFNDPSKSHPFHMDGLVPLRLFGGRDGRNALSFEVAPTLDGFPGVTVTDLGAMTITLGVVYLRKLRVPSPSELYTATTSERALRLDSVGRLQYLVIRDRKKSASDFSADEIDYSGLDLTIGGEGVWSGRTAPELAKAFNTQRRGPGIDQISTTAPPFVPVIFPSLRSLRSKLTKGRVVVNIGTRSVHTETRILVRDTGRHRTDLARRWMSILGIANVEGGSMVPVLGPDGKGQMMGAELDQAGYSGELAAEIVRSKSQR